MQRREFLNTAGRQRRPDAPLGRHAWAATTADGAAGAGTPATRLVVVLLRGAVDGLSVVAPSATRTTTRARRIALARPGQDGGVLDLDGHFGLHPALAPLMPLWQQQKLAFVHATGSPDPTRSHFDAQDYMESGTPGRKGTPDGWLNRLLGRRCPARPRRTRALSIGADHAAHLSGRAAAANIANGAAGTKPTLLDRPAVGKAFDALYAGDDAIRRAYRDGRTRAPR